jgi:hypothetical protein
VCIILNVTKGASIVGIYNIDPLLCFLVLYDVSLAALL